MKLIINIPAFNEEEKIAQTISRVPKSFAGIDEVVVQVIDDGSTDQTVAVVQNAGVKLIYSNGVNRGIGKTFRNAVERSLENGADIMVNIDADGQFDPNDIVKLITPILTFQADIVIADRFGKHKAKNIPVIKSVINRLAAKIIGRFMNTDIKDLTCGFRAYNRESLLRLNLPGDYTYTQETIIDALGKHLAILWIPVEVTYFSERKSRVVKSIANYISNSARIIIKAIRDVRPMKFFGIPGALLILVSFVFFLIFLFHYLVDFKISPYRNQLFFGAGFFIVGLQFVVFALIADMIRSNRRLTEDQIYLTKKELYKKRS